MHMRKRTLLILTGSDCRSSEALSKLDSAENKPFGTKVQASQHECPESNVVNPKMTKS